jgi:hypothetical protein
MTVHDSRSIFIFRFTALYHYSYTTATAIRRGVSGGARDGHSLEQKDSHVPFPITCLLSARCSV